MHHILGLINPRQTLTWLCAHQNLPEDQCVFIRGFRVARTFRILPKQLKAAAGPSSDLDGYNFEPDIEVVSIPATAMVTFDFS